MKKKILIISAILFFLIYILCFKNVNNKYPEYIVHSFSENDEVIVNDVTIKINDYRIMEPTHYYHEFSNVEKVSDSLLYIVFEMQFSNNCDEPKSLDLTYLRLVQDTWSEFFFLPDLYSINNISSYEIQIMPHCSGKLIIPFMYKSMFNDNADDVINKGFTLYIKYDYPNWNEYYSFHEKKI